MPSYIDAKNRRLFTPTSWERGRDYFREGRVELTYVDKVDGEVHANVYGSQKYALRLHLKEFRLHSATCNCPYAFGGYCKHIAAVLFALDGTRDSKQDEESECQYFLSSVLPTIYGERKDDLSSYFRSAFSLLSHIRGFHNFTPQHRKDCFIAIFSLLSPNQKGLTEAGVAAYAYFEKTNFKEEEKEAVLSSLLSLFQGEGKAALFACLFSSQEAKRADAILIASIQNGTGYHFLNLLPSDTPFFLDLSHEALSALSKANFLFHNWAPLADALQQKGEEELLKATLLNPESRFEEKKLLLYARLFAESGDKETAFFIAKKDLSFYGFSLSMALAYQVLCAGLEEAEDYFLSLAKKAGKITRFRLLANPESSPMEEWPALSLDEWAIVLPSFRKKGIPYAPSLSEAAQEAIEKGKSEDAETLLTLLQEESDPQLLQILLSPDLLELTRYDPALRKAHIELLLKNGSLSFTRIRRYEP